MSFATSATSENSYCGFKTKLGGGQTFDFFLSEGHIWDSSDKGEVTWLTIIYYSEKLKEIYFDI